MTGWRWRYFKPEEFKSRDGAESPFPYEVKPELLDFLDELRSRFGKPLLVTSGYRSPAHNKAVGGVPNSFHTQGLAADLRPLDAADLNRLWQLVNSMNTDGGVGRYDSFVHVDRRGYAARFDKREKQ